MLEIPVKLIVKAPNQQVEDQTIHCSLSWTIKRLKGYLSEVYPSKPNTEDQRLIYYGQLLNDSVTLKDVFTRYEAGEETHTVHLVCMPSKESLKMQARKMAEENSKKAIEGNAGVASTSQRVPAGDRERNADESREETLSTARNYIQYGYQQWMNGISSQPFLNNNNNNNSSSNNNNNTNNNITDDNNINNNYYHYIQQWAWAQQVYANYYMNQCMDMIARQNGVGFREGYDDSRQQEAVRNPEPQPPRDAEVDDNRLNRDWLDYFYTMSRLLVLLSIVYFYSSPARFLIVSSLGMAFYLYQIGFFRINQLQPLENNNEAVNNNIPADNNNVIPPGDVAGAERAPQAAQPNAEQEAPEHPSFFALTWTFVTSFFFSMIPETQNAL